MATPFDDLVTCPVCFENHDDPKRLPVCDHVFCVTCLGRIVTEGVIICPNCNSENTVPAGGVKNLKTDQTAKKMVESFRCTDCKTVEQQSKQCIYCHVVVCSTCAVIHDSKEKCGLISSIRSLSLNVPTSEETQNIEQLEVEWTIFREKNAEEKNETSASIDMLADLLQERKTALMKKYEEYDKFAEERLKWLKEAKEMETHVQDLKKFINEKKVETVRQVQTNAERHSEFLSKKKQILSQHVPENLGTIKYSARLLQFEISPLGCPIVDRTAGEDKDSEIVWSSPKGTTFEGKINAVTRIYSEEKVAEGKMEIVRERGGNYTLRVKDEAEAIKWSKTWNNTDDSKPRMYPGVWLRVMWFLSNKDEYEIPEIHATMISDIHAMMSFSEAMRHISAGLYYLKAFISSEI